jgi:hypothetical protein
MKMNKL